MTATDRMRCNTFDPAESQMHPAVVIELVTTVALVLSTLIAVTAVSIGIARADTLVRAALAVLCQ